RQFIMITGKPARGGGGLIAGIAAYVKYLRPEIK
ncbi:hypothetical protein PSYMO_38368, partial [Pseudomonas amygdali pv. mori str. 301020]